jgi:hypothetical protein
MERKKEIDLENIFLLPFDEESRLFMMSMNCCLRYDIV